MREIGEAEALEVAVYLTENDCLNKMKKSECYKSKKQTHLPFTLESMEGHVFLLRKKREIDGSIFIRRGTFKKVTEAIHVETGKKFAYNVINVSREARKHVENERKKIADFVAQDLSQKSLVEALMNTDHLSDEEAKKKLVDLYCANSLKKTEQDILKDIDKELSFLKEYCDCDESEVLRGAPHDSSRENINLQKQEKDIIVTFITPLAEGTADDVATEGGWDPLNMKEALKNVVQNLLLMHEDGWVHHDIKPENLLLSEGQLRLNDFGMARSREDKNYTGGSLSFLPKDIVEGKMVDPRMKDVYALVMTMYALLFGGTKALDKQIMSFRQPIPQALESLNKKIVEQMNVIIKSDITDEEKSIFGIISYTIKNYNNMPYYYFKIALSKVFDLDPD